MFALVFVFEVLCAARRRIVAFQSGEQAAMKLYPRLFSSYRYEMRCGWLILATSRDRAVQAEALEGSCWYSFGKPLHSKSECC